MASRLLGKSYTRWVQSALGGLEYLGVVRALGAYLGVSGPDLARYRYELRESGIEGKVRRAWEKGLQKSIGLYRGGVSVGFPNEVLYLLVRISKPEKVVETGVAAGFSTAYLLQALRDNGKGTLFSVDVGNRVPEGHRTESGALDKSWSVLEGEIGLVVPAELRSNWQLTIGESRSTLSNLLTELGQIDVFWHDSDHSYSNMQFEFDTAWAALTDGGLLVSDDIVQNSAFQELALKVSAHPMTFFSRGVILKNAKSAAI